MKNPPNEQFKSSSQKNESPKRDKQAFKPPLTRSKQSAQPHTDQTLLRYDVHQEKGADIKNFLNLIRNKAKSEREKGELFERAIGDFLRQSPEHDFENVWMRKDWPDLKKYGLPKRDLGIDLIAQEKETGKFWAIQCKCYDENYQVNKSDIDSFFTESGKNPFSARLIVTTTNNWSSNAEEALNRQTKHCATLTLSDLERKDFEWNLQNVKRKNIRKKLRLHQKEAVEKSLEYFKTQDRGKLIMACGTGKTFTSLRIIEKTTPQNANVLFLAPSISLISQTLREYAYERKQAQRYIVVCSDSKAGKDSDGIDVNDLSISPTTDPSKIAKRLKQKVDKRTIVFCTYQSLSEIKKAQKRGFPIFDLVVCDEAHRTTGIEGSQNEKGETKGNYFTLINNSNYVKAKKRLYMTATPRIYKENIKKKAQKQYEADIHSMDDESVFGKEIYRLEFSKAIKHNLLSDYKVIILSIDQQYMSDELQDVLLKNTKLTLDDASRLIGCYKALRDQGEENGQKLSRAVGFLQGIKSSKAVKAEFQKVVKALDEHKNDGFTCETEHIDGTDNSITRNKKLDWLKKDAGYTEKEEKICRILMNAKCLTEGIDVPNLDAVMFLHPRKSQVDVVQAVGRAIRKQEDKKYGYVILPVVIPAGKSPEQALDDNSTYKVVWQVLNALRSHDKEFNAEINNLPFNKRSKKIKIIGIGKGKKSENKTTQKENITDKIHDQLELNIKDIEDKIYAKIVKKCGDIFYEDQWIKKVEQTCKTVSTRINSLLKTKPKIKKEFDSYLSGLKSSLNEGISEKEAISMLSEHLITKPAFDKIFENYKFSENNPVSKTMKKVLDQLNNYGFNSELKDVEKFYKNIGNRLDKISNSEGRQAIIKDLYERFIKTAFPKMAGRLGVAYTPIEIVDFILQSANELLKQEFNKGLTDKNVHILEPFAGTGMFINRLISDENLIKEEDLSRKFSKEIHVNEIMLLPYYVASINIESAYNSRMGGKYKHFPGIVLTDTFECYEQEKYQAKYKTVFFQENKKRLMSQKHSAIQVIIGNPPYSAGQNSENDANKNTVHPKLHKKIEETYVRESSTTFKGALYDSYIKAIRWATDRIGDKGGIIGFVHNASLVNERSIGGLRKSLVKEFDSIYCFNLRGNQRTKGELSKKEGGKIFGGSSRTPIAITFLVKNPTNQRKQANIQYYDIGDYLSRESKLEKIKSFGCIQGIKKARKWKNIIPDKYGDWINQRDDSFEHFLPMGDRYKNSNTIFNLYSCGVKTNRDSWVYNFDKIQVKKNMKNMIEFYNQELHRLKNQKLDTKNIDKFINREENNIKWTHRIKEKLIQKNKLLFEKYHIKLSSYRPFMKSWIYFDHLLNERRYQLPRIFNKDIENKVICVSGIGAKTFSVLITDAIPDLQYLQNGQCFPLYWFNRDGHKKDSITDNILKRFQSYYRKQNAFQGDSNHISSLSENEVSENILKFKNQSPSKKSITKEDIFYYIYGLLHSESYREKYKFNLNKSLPHIPMVPDFWGFSSIGRKLADLHLNYENQLPPKGIKILKDGKEIRNFQFLKPKNKVEKRKDSSLHHTKDWNLPKELTLDHLKVNKMKYNKNDKSKIQFNEHITISNIPEEAWEYKINDWSALKWIVERYQYKQDKKTKLINDPNTYSEDPAYILKLLMSVITVSLKTRELVQSLPSIDFDLLIADLKKAG